MYFFSALVSDATIWWCFIFHDQNKICWNIFFPHSQKKHIFIFRKNTRNQKKYTQMRKILSKYFLFKNLLLSLYKKKCNRTICRPHMVQMWGSVVWIWSGGYTSISHATYLNCWNRKGRKVGQTKVTVAKVSSKVADETKDITYTKNNIMQLANNNSNEICNEA